MTLTVVGLLAHFGDEPNGSGLLSDQYDIVRKEELLDRDSRGLLSAGELLIRQAEGLIDDEQIPVESRDAVARDIRDYYAAFDRPGGPIPQVLAGYFSSIGSFVILHSDALAALEAAGTAEADALAAMIRAGRDALGSDDPAKGLDEVADRYGELVSMTDETGDGVQAAVEQLGWRGQTAEAAIGLTSGGAAAMFARAALVEVGVTTGFATIGGLGLALVAMLAYLHKATPKRRSKPRDP